MGASLPITLEATLYYQTTSRDYVEFLRDQAVDNDFPDDCLPRSTGLPGTSRGELMYDLWTTYDRSPPVPMATAETTLGDSIFADGFESGDVLAWSASVP